MTREEAALILDPETSRDALLPYESQEERIAVCEEACRLGAAALREQEERENPKPLTLADLREMDREPVWIKLFDPDEEFWVLRNDWVDTRNPEPIILLHGRWYLHDDYGKTWLAYRQKPKEV